MCAAVLLCAAALCGAACANSYIIFPYTNIAEYNSELHAGDVLAMINNDGQTDITLSGSGNMVYFATTNFVPGDYSKSIAGAKTQTYRVSKPDARINIQIYDVSGSELANSHGVSLDQGLVFKVTPYISQLPPKALVFETPDGGSSTFFGNLNTAVGTSTGLQKQADGSYVFTVENLREAGVKKGEWDVRVLFDRSSFIGGSVPDQFLKSSSYNEQMSGSSYVSQTYKMDPVLIKTVTPTPVKTQTPVKTPTPTSTPTPTPTATPTPTPVPTPEYTETVPVEQTTAAAASPLPVFGLLAGLGLAVFWMRKE